MTHTSTSKYDVGKPETFSIDEEGVGHFYGHEEESLALSKEITGRLDFPTKEKDSILTLVENHTHSTETIKAVRRKINKIGEGDTFRLMQLREADGHPQDFRLFEKAKSIPNSKSSMEITGKDLIKEGAKPGPKMGQILNYLESKQLESDRALSREELLSISKEKFPEEF